MCVFLSKLCIHSNISICIPSVTGGGAYWNCYVYQCTDCDSDYLLLHCLTQSQALVAWKWSVQGESENFSVGIDCILRLLLPCQMLCNDRMNDTVYAVWSEWRGLILCCVVWMTWFNYNILCGLNDLVWQAWMLWNEDKACARFWKREKTFQVVTIMIISGPACTWTAYELRCSTSGTARTFNCLQTWPFHRPTFETIAVWQWPDGQLWNMLSVESSLYHVDLFLHPTRSITFPHADNRVLSTTWIQSFTLTVCRLVPSWWWHCSTPRLERVNSWGRVRACLCACNMKSDGI